MDPEGARAYLLHDQIGAQHDRWAQVGEYLTDHPDSIAAHALNNPLTLSLARGTYQDQDPISLTDPTEFSTVAALREHLIDRTLITAYPDERQRAHATRWLAWIAHHMGSDRNLAWWHIPTWISRWQLQLAGVLAVGFVGVLAIVLAAGLMVGFMFGLPGEVGKEPQAIFPTWPRPRVLASVVVGVGGLMGELTFVLLFGIVFVFSFGIVGLLFDFWVVPLPRAATATPTASYRIDRRTSIAVGLGLGLGIAVGLGLGSGLRSCSGSCSGSRPGRCPRSVSPNSFLPPPEPAK